MHIDVELCYTTFVVCSNCHTAYLIGAVSPRPLAKVCISLDSDQFACGGRLMEPADLDNTMVGFAKWAAKFSNTRSLSPHEDR